MTDFQDHLADVEAGKPAPPPARDTAADAVWIELERLWKLDTVGVHITGGDLIGSGSRASAFVHLSTGESIDFDMCFGDMSKPAKLNTEICAVTGAIAMLKQGDAMRSVQLFRAGAAHAKGVKMNSTMRDWGAEHLRLAQQIPVAMSDQGDRWRVFSDELNGHEPVNLYHHDQRTHSFSTYCKVLVDTDAAARYVRCGDYADMVRQRHERLSNQEIGHRMEVVGWTRRGTEGRIKATCPTDRKTLQWAFYDVRADWDTNDK